MLPVVKAGESGAAVVLSALSELMFDALLLCLVTLFVLVFVVVLFCAVTFTWIVFAPTFRASGPLGTTELSGENPPPFTWTSMVAFESVGVAVTVTLIVEFGTGPAE